MTVYIEKPALNLRSELASLRNQGGYQEQQFYFDGLVTNGTFDADTNWTKATGWTISGGVATKVSTESSAVISQLVNLAAGSVYKISYVITNVTAGGVFRADITGGTNFIGANRGTATGTFTESFTATLGNDTIRLVGSPGFEGSFDNISIFETDGTDVIHTMPQGWKPKDFFEDGLLQREGAANDYEVIYDGFDYVIKPTVAPSATTQTCVIGVKA